MKESLVTSEEIISEKNVEISELQARLKYYEEDLGFQKQDRIPKVKKLNYMLDHDFPVNQIMQRPPDEARVFIEAQHNKNLGMWSKCVTWNDSTTL